MKVAIGIPMIPPVVPSPASQVPFGEDGGSPCRKTPDEWFTGRAADEKQ